MRVHCTLRQSIGDVVSALVFDNIVHVLIVSSLRLRLPVFYVCRVS